MDMPTAGSCQLVEQVLRFFQVGGVEALGKPAVDGCREIARLGPPALVTPQPGEARRGAQFERLRLLLPGDSKRFVECDLGVVRSSPCEQAQAFEAVELGFPPALAGFSSYRQR